jgi:hypothetical protein
MPICPIRKALRRGEVKSRCRDIIEIGSSGIYILD